MQFLATLYTNQSQLDDAVRMYNLSQFRSSDGAFEFVVRNNLAMLLVKRGKKDDLDEAFCLAKKLFLAHPKNAVIMDTYGWVLFHHGNFEEAQEMLEKAIEMDPNLPDPHYHLAKIYHDQGNLDNAKYKLKHALELSDTFFEADDVRNLLSVLLENV